MVKQIYSRCEDPLFRMLILKTVPLQDIKESTDKMFFGHALNTNLPRATHVHHSFEERNIIEVLMETYQPLEISRRMTWSGLRLMIIFHGSLGS